MVKSLIMGFGTNQQRDALSVFLRSARRQYSTDECDIALVTNSVSGIEDLLQETGTIALNTPNTYSATSRTRRTRLFNKATLLGMRGSLRAGLLKTSPETVAGYHQLIETWHHPHFARWFAYQRLLKTFHAYDLIVLADTKDVVFQARLFDEIPPSGVSIFEDGSGFSPDSCNARWYVDAYGASAYQRVAKHEPICVGVIAGGLPALQSFVREFCASIALDPFGRIEQAVFNKMYLNNEFSEPFHVFPNLAGPVLTMSGDRIEEKITEHQGQIRNPEDDRLYPVVHMYDRFAGLREAVRSRYC